MTHRWSTLVLLVSGILLGCTADLKKVHVPHLLVVTPNEEVRYSAPAKPPTYRATATDKSGWRVYASLSEPEFLADNDPTTATSAPDPLTKDQFILIDLGAVSTFGKVIQRHADEAGFPKKFRIDVAGEHNFPYTLAYIGYGCSGATTAVFRQPACCRFLRITLLEPTETPWSVAEIDLE